MKWARTDVGAGMIASRDIAYDIGGEGCVRRCCANHCLGAASRHHATVNPHTALEALAM